MSYVKYITRYMNDTDGGCVGRVNTAVKVAEN